MGWRPTGRISSPGGIKNFYFRIVQTGSGAHPAYYPMGTGDLPWKSGRRNMKLITDYSPNIIEVLKTCIYTSNSPVRFHGIVLT
jgi:hypothetical protein